MQIGCRLVRPWSVAPFFTGYAGCNKSVPSAASVCLIAFSTQIRPEIAGRSSQNLRIFSDIALVFQSILMTLVVATYCQINVGLRHEPALSGAFG